MIAGERTDIFHIDFRESLIEKRILMLNLKLNSASDIQLFEYGTNVRIFL